MVTIFNLAKEKISDWPKSGPTGPVATPLRSGGQKVPRVSRVVADLGFDFGRGIWRARGARACNGGLGAEPPAGSRGRVQGQSPWSGGQGGEAPPEAESL